MSHETSGSLENDGWRCQIHTTTQRLWSWHGTDLSSQFSDVADAAAGLPDTVLDGELVAVLNNGSGVAFDWLQTRAGRRGPRRGADFTVHVAIFDVLAVVTLTGGLARTPSAAPSCCVSSRVARPLCARC
ncbi:hypothetical protein ACFV7R_42925 [Streptomyces sp. NPDC059866]|uniref:ATP-dependent DNA ligase n=1 Tax=Streptomyces sp. NPDC059866 TaxID=3346978 RepID=UPI003662AD8B